MKMEALQILVKNMETKELTEKKQLRKVLIEKRRLLDKEYRYAADLEIARKVLELKYYQAASNVFIYSSTDDEADTVLITQKALSADKKVYFPKVVAAGIMNFYQVKAPAQDLCSGYMGILEPDTSRCDAAQCTPDIIIMPGVGFDNNLNRLGYGGGFYDRYLERLSDDTVKIAISYDVQHVDKIPVLENDIKADILITEKGIWTREKFSLNI